MSNVTHLPQREGLTASEVLEAIPGLTYRQLDFWSRTGRIQPGPYTPGKGHNRHSTPEQVVIVSRMFRLLHLGFEFDAAHQIATDRPTAEKVLRGVSTIVIEHTFSEDDPA
jgi:DNA-binding transcriptional MerR regulator